MFIVSRFSFGWILLKSAIYSSVCRAFSEFGLYKTMIRISILYMYGLIVVVFFTQQM